jgi:hypothetical protein
VRIDVRYSPEYQATMYAVRMLPRTLQKLIRQHTKRIAQPEWSKALQRRVSTALERRVIADTAVVSVTNQNVRVVSAGKGRAMSGGLLPKVHYPAVEFGAQDDAQVYDRRSAKGTPHRVTRHTARQLRPRNPNGYVFRPAATEMVPRMFRLWAQTVVKTTGYAIEGKQE